MANRLILNLRNGENYGLPATLTMETMLQFRTVETVVAEDDIEML